MKIQVYAKRYMNMLVVLMLTAPVILMTAGCDEIDSGEVQNTVVLPLDSTLNFACADEGIFPEDCVLDNAENPYASVAVTEDNKFQLSDEAPSEKSRYYLWATALAKGAGLQGENQYYTAVALHVVYGESGSPTTRDQSVKAYRSVLDNFFLAPTFDDSGIAYALKDFVGVNLTDPTSAGLPPLYPDPVGDNARSDLSEWGYIYDIGTGIMSIFQP
jgi:hypothetical protein